MTPEIINVGPAPNDGLGDPLRDAFIKCNVNFAEIFSLPQPNPPANALGKVGDTAGMYAYDSSNFYYCYANYTGNTSIWGTAGSGGGGNGSAIINGTSNVVIGSTGSNVTVGVAGTSNVAVFSTVGAEVTGLIFQPRTVTANIDIPPDTNAQMLGPFTIGNSVSGNVPANSSLYIIG